MRLSLRLKKILSGSFIQDLSKLSFGTFAGRLIALAALPLLTRLYSPDDFGLLATFLALVSTISVVACLRLEIAISIADSDEDAIHLLVLAIMAIVTVTIASAAIIYSFPSQITSLLKQPSLEAYLWLIPLGIVTISTYATFQYWTIRAKQFSRIAKTRLTQAIASVSTMLTLGLVGLAPLGLLVGKLINTGAGGASLALSAWKNESNKIKGVTRQGLLKTLKNYKKYPTYSVLEAIFNTAAVQIPLIIVAANSAKEAGYMFLAMQIMAVPVGLIGADVSKVYAPRAAKALQVGDLESMTKGIMFQLFKLGVGPFVVTGLFAPYFFPYIFGDHWQQAGEIISWLTPGVFLQFIVSPVSMALHVTGNQVYAMIFQAFGFFMFTGVVLIAATIIPKALVLSYAASVFTFYTLYIFLIITVLKKCKLDAAHNSVAYE